jgi:hypothetical protein
MKHRFRSLTGTAWIAAAVIWAGVAGELRGQAGSSVSPTVDAQRLVAEAGRLVAAEPAIGADLRYRVEAFGQDLIGSGSYFQWGEGPEKLLRLELKMLVGEQPATLLEIRGRETYWLRREVPPTLPVLGRVDLRKFRKSVAPLPTDARAAAPASGWLLMGGLPRLLLALEQNFAFSSAQQDELQFKSSEGDSLVRLPIWKVEGEWKPERLAALTQKQPSRLGVAADHMPTRVELVLGRTDDILPLFPYRVTYLRAADEASAAGSRGEGAAHEQTLLSLEFFNVSRRGGFDPALFDYQPGEQEVQNLTTSYVQRFREEMNVR